MAYGLRRKKQRYRRCVGACIINAENKVLVAERVTIKNAWQMPQGGIDVGEMPKQALFRELKEEIGVSMEHFELLARAKNWISYDFPEELMNNRFYGRNKGQTQIWYLLRFTGDVSHIDLKSTGHPEFSRFKWVDFSELEDLVVDFKKHVYAAVVDEFQKIVTTK